MSLLPHLDRLLLLPQFNCRLSSIFSSSISSPPPFTPLQSFFSHPLFQINGHYINNPWIACHHELAIEQQEIASEDRVFIIDQCVVVDEYILHKCYFGLRSYFLCFLHDADK